MATTAAAAAQAGVTVATIRTWCRRGVIAATKTAGRWIIDTASLTHRIAIGAMRARKATPVPQPKPTRLTPEQRAEKADQIRARIRAAITLPAMTGSDKQIAWAEDIRAGRIDRALAHVVVLPTGAPAYSLLTLTRDPLLVGNFRETPGSWEWDSEEALIAAIDLALAGTDALRGTRTSASWWINNRDRSL